MDNYHKQSQSNEFINNYATDFYKTKVRNRLFLECLRACAYQSIAEQFLYSRNLPAKVRRSFDPKNKKKIFEINRGEKPLLCRGRTWFLTSISSRVSLRCIYLTPKYPFKGQTYHVKLHSSLRRVTCEKSRFFFF